MTQAYRATLLLKSHGDEQAERWSVKGLKTAGLDEKDLRALKGTDPRKLVLAELLWKRTTVSKEWIAEKLRMRSGANLIQP
jgi:putative transposase